MYSKQQNGVLGNCYKKNYLLCNKNNYLLKKKVLEVQKNRDKYFIKRRFSFKEYKGRKYNYFKNSCNLKINGQLDIR